MKCSLGISNFLEEISSFSHFVVFLYFFTSITEEGFLISPCFCLELCIQMVYLSFSPLPLASQDTGLYFWEDVEMDGLPLWLSGKESTCNEGVTGDTGLIPGSGRSPRGGHDNLLQCSCLEKQWTEKRGGLQPIALQRVRHDWRDSACMNRDHA